MSSLLHHEVSRPLAVFRKAFLRAKMTQKAMPKDFDLSGWADGPMFFFFFEAGMGQREMVNGFHMVDIWLIYD